MYGIGDFERDKMHALKFLWIFERRVSLVIEMMEDLGDDPFEKMKKFPSVASAANDRLLIETGMTENQLLEAIMVGTYIAEYRELEKMSDYEREEYLALMENEATFDEVFPGFGEAFDQVKKDFEQKQLRQKDFDDIIKSNFGDDNDEF